MIDINESLVNNKTNTLLDIRYSSLHISFQGVDLIDQISLTYFSADTFALTSHDAWSNSKEGFC